MNLINQNYHIKRCNKLKTVCYEGAMLSQEFTYRSLKTVIENLQHSLEELSFQKDNTHIDELYKLKLLSSLRTLDIHTDYPQINSYVERVLKPEMLHVNIKVISNISKGIEDKVIVAKYGTISNRVEKHLIWEIKADKILW